MEREIEKVILIVNPNSRKGKGIKKEPRIIKYFNEAGLSVRVVHTSKRGDAITIAKNAADDGFSTIVAVGGDGTVNEVVNGIMLSPHRSDVKMGIIPIGRGNDFAWVAKISTDVKKAVAAIVNGRAKLIDVGVATSEDVGRTRYFLNGTGFGFEPMVNFIAMDMKHINGMLSYILAFLKILKAPPDGYRVTLALDDREPLKLSTQQISVSNGIRMGSAFKMTPLADIEDGKLDVMFTKKIFKGIGLLKLVLSFLRGEHVEDKENFGYERAERIIIESERNDLPVHSDGEIFTKSGQSFDIRVLKGVLNLLT